MIWNLPFIHAIARQTPSGNVTLLTKRRSRADQLLACDRYIDAILWLERNGGEHDGIGGIRQLARELRRRQFASVWILHQSARYALVARLAGIPRRIGYGAGSQRWLLSRGLYLPAGKLPRHPIDAGRQLLQHMHIAIDSTQPCLAVDAARQQEVRGKWQPADTDIHIVVGIGSSEAFKIWPAEYFAELIEKITQHSARIRFYLFGSGSTEQALADRIEQHTQRSGADVVKVLDRPIGEAVHLLSVSDLYIGNDSGFLNIAAALNIPAIGIFGASPPLQYSALIHPVPPPAGVISGFERSGQGIRSISVDRVYQTVAGHLP
jgi:heptosyltransferase-2